MKRLRNLCDHFGDKNRGLVVMDSNRHGILRSTFMGSRVLGAMQQQSSGSGCEGLGLGVGGLGFRV